MINQLETSQFLLARPLFCSLEQTQPMCTSVLEGIYPGKVYIDSTNHPAAALLTTFIESEAHGVWCFLAGKPDNLAFNQDLNQAILSRQIVPAEAPLLFLTYDPQSWESQVEILFSPYQPLLFPRLHFISRKLDYDWRSTLPAGISVAQINNDLRNIPGLELPQDINATLAKWQAIADPRFMDFGFVILDTTCVPPRVASWATVDFIANAAGDLGFFTQPDYRQRGLGTLAVAAVLEHGSSMGLKQVNWTCDADNQGSFHTAEKLGLERIEDYNMVVVIFRK